MRIALILGTRPEIIKMSPVIRELLNKKVEFFIVHTGQHYSYNMDEVFFEQLRLPKPKYNLEIGSGSHAQQTAKIMVNIEKVFIEENPDVILVQGDTNTVLAAALTATKLHIKVGHIEAGLRSYDQQMPEEVNRILTDHCSNYLFAPTEKARTILLNEGILDNTVTVTGNTIVDAVYQSLEISNHNPETIQSLELVPKGYFLATIHRQENVDDFERFSSILSGLQKITTLYQIPLIYPIHPRSKKMIDEFKLGYKNLTLIEPLDYLGFLQLEKNARLVLTDSGGVQEECCILGVPCVTIRENTERTETIEVGANILSGTSPRKILQCSEIMLRKNHSWSNPFGDGKAGEKIVEKIIGGNDG
jgi:UDP-N-acetylglucosamine 2-epimerase (non-hydrolysing)